VERLKKKEEGKQGKKLLAEAREVDTPPNWGRRTLTDPKKLGNPRIYGE